MLSLAYITPAHAVEGTEVSVLWGAPGSAQRLIRATVTRFPYNPVMRNDETDVDQDFPRTFYILVPPRRAVHPSQWARHLSLRGKGEAATFSQGGRLRHVVFKIHGEAETGIVGEIGTGV